MKSFVTVSVSARYFADMGLRNLKVFGIDKIKRQVVKKEEGGKY